MEYTKEEYKGYTIDVLYDEDPQDPREWNNVAVFACEHSRYKMGDECDVLDTIDGLFDAYVSSQQILTYFVSSRQAVLKSDEDGSYWYQWREDAEDRCSYLFDPDSDEIDEIAEMIVDELRLDERLKLIIATGDVVVRPISMYEHGGVSTWLGDYICHVDAQWDCEPLGIAYITKATAEKEMLDFSEETWKDWANKQIENEMEVWSAYVSGEVYGFTITAPNGDMCDTVCFGYYGEAGLEQLMSEAKEAIDGYAAVALAEREQVLECLNNHIEVFGGLKLIDENRLYEFRCTNGIDMTAAYEIGADRILGKPEAAYYPELSEDAIHSLYNYIKNHK